MIERIRPADSSDKKEKTSSPDSKRFKEMMKVDETPEISPDERRKKKPKQLEEEKPPQFQTVYKKESSTPQPTNSVEPKIPPKQESSQDQITDSKIIKEMMGKEKKEKSSSLPSHLEGTFGTVQIDPKVEEALIKEKKKKVVPKEALPPTTISPETTKSQKEEKMKKEKVLEGYQQISSLPYQIQERAAAITSKMSSYLDPELQPLFEKMVGTLIHVTKQGIERTQITLNSPTFATSRFYGATITIERYATAPDSFNITLMGNAPAVSFFNENVDSLMRALQRTNQSFRIGRLSAEHEEVIRPLIRRKKRLGSEGSGVE